MPPGRWSRSVGLVAAEAVVSTVRWSRNALGAMMGAMSRLTSAALGALAGLGVAVVLGVGAGVVVGINATAEAPVGASSKATILAAGISEAMNCAAFAAIILVPVGAVVFLRRRSGQ